MPLLTLLSTTDVQIQLSETVKKQRKRLKLSRASLAELSTVPASTIKKFETTGQISLRQFILLWQSVDSLDSLMSLTKIKQIEPKTIDDVLKL
jgi:hypothetical protein